MKKQIIVLVLVGILALSFFVSFDKNIVVAYSDYNENGVNETGNQTNNDTNETIPGNYTNNNGNQTGGNEGGTNATDNQTNNDTNEGSNQNDSQEHSNGNITDDPNSAINNISKGRPWSNVSEGLWNKGLGKGLDKILNKSHGRTYEDMEEEINEWKNKFKNITDKELQEKINQSKKLFGQFKQELKFFGRMKYENGFASGNLIQFMFDEMNGTILSYTLLKENSKISVFDLVEIDPFVPKDDPYTRGAVWRCNAENVKLEAHDNPTALLKIKSHQNKTVTFHLSDNITLSETNSNNILSISGAIDGKLVVAGSIKDNNTTDSEIILNSDMISISLYNNSQVFFIASPVEGIGVGIEIENENKIQNAIANGKVGARIYVQKKNQTHNETYTDIDIKTEIAEGKVVIVVNSTEKNGKTVVVDIDFETMNISESSEIIVIFDGEEITMADNYEDLFNSSNNVNESKYLIILGTNGIQVLVSIPSFSEHTITISQASIDLEEDEDDQTPVENYTIYLLVFAVIIITILLYAFYNKRK